MWVQSQDQENPLEKEISSHLLFQYSCLKNPMDGGTSRLRFIGSINSWTQLSTPHSPCIYVYTHTYTHTNIYTHTHTYLNIYIHTHMYKGGYIYIYISFLFLFSY